MSKGLSKWRQLMKKKDIIKKIGKDNWLAFCRWMCGQTCSTYPDGEINYYSHDVEAFIKKMNSGYDRQEDPLAWD